MTDKTIIGKESKIGQYMEKPDITSKLVLVTPEMATNWLAQHNFDNRRMRPWWSEALASAMRRGEWMPTHQGIAFTKSGRFADGQHRLKAVALSNTSVWMFVFHDLPDDAFKVLDIGIKRNIADTTGLSKRTAELARLAGQVKFSGSATPTQIAEIAKCGLGEVSDRLNEYCPTNRAKISTAPVRLAACALVMDGYGEDEVFKTFAGMIHQKFEELPPVANCFIRQASNAKTIAGHTYEWMARALKALNPTNAKLTKIQISESDSSAAAAYVKSILTKSMESAT
jgi:hypothetical protein